jgi:hypothetical protein
MSIPSTELNKDDERLVVSPRRARHLLDIGNTRLYELLAAGELDSFLDGRSRRITVDSIHGYISRRLLVTAQRMKKRDRTPDPPSEQENCDPRHAVLQDSIDGGGR